jgi:predicted restriction endonuclease
MDKRDKDIAEMLRSMGYSNATDLNIKYRRRKLSLAKYDGKSHDYYARRIAIKEYGDACELCGYTETTDVHHIRGRKVDGFNELPNLMMVCQNCHAIITRKNIIVINSRLDIPEAKTKIIEVIKRAYRSIFCI